MNLSREYDKYEFRTVRVSGTVYFWYVDNKDSETWVLLGRNGEVVTTDNGNTFRVTLTSAKLADSRFSELSKEPQVIQATAHNIRSLLDHVEPFKTSILKRGRKGTETVKNTQPKALI